MSNKNIEQFSEWQNRADEDLGTAHILLDKSEYPATVCFHAHQAVEKYLKGYLALNDHDPIKTHQLDILIELAGKYNETFAGLLEDADSLNDYYIESRYPTEKQDKISLDEAKDAIIIAEKIKSFILSII